MVEELCGKSISKSFISTLTSQLDEIVETFMTRKFETSYPFLMSDVLYIKVRENNRVISKALHIVLSITQEGQREVLGFRLDDSENTSSWQNIYSDLLKRGLKGVKMVISDAHKGEVEAIKNSFIGASWQRCQVHFMRNVFNHLPKKNTLEVRSELLALFKMTHIDAAREFKNYLVEKYSEVYPKTIETLDMGFEDGFQYCSIEETNYSRLKSTNMLERVNQEIRRREKIIRIFPNVSSALGLIGTLLIDIHEEWTSSQRQYIQFNQETVKWFNA